MAQKLCWNITANGKYCKNYKLKNESACYTHTHTTYKENDSLKINLLLLCMYITFITFIYHQNDELINKWVSIILDNLKEYSMQLYKMDKNMYYIYLRACLNTMFAFLIKKGIYILKMLK